MINLLACEVCTGIALLPLLGGLLSGLLALARAKGHSLRQLARQLLTPARPD